MEKQKIFQVNFSHFPTDKNVARIPEKMFLIDNFDEKKGYSSEDIMDFPVQVTMALTFICTAGEATLSINLQQYKISAGYIACIHPGSFFQFLDASHDQECACIAISPNIMPVNFDVKLGMETAMALKKHPVFHPSLKEFAEILSAYKSIKEVIYREDFKFKEEVAKNYIEILRWNIMDRIMREKDLYQQTRPSSRKEEIFMKFIATVQKYYTNERNVTFYADKLCVSPKYLSAVVHEVSGKYATQWITDYVILECKAMLKAEGDSVKNVCNRLNFANQSFFAKYFKQHTGMTPREYKNK
ncbi:MAG: helix-turn-helix domain-containing protein [Bacteroidaceae bacterium]|nr:helix-turn-helix domain-containing protein [Bacteroidaceae bacterium]